MDLRTSRALKYTKCPECGSNELIEDYEQGEIICQSCGLVTSEIVIDKGADWRAFTREEDLKRKRVGRPISYSISDKGLPTAIYRIDRDAYGKKLPISERLKMLKLKKLQFRVRPSIEKNLIRAMSELDRLADNLHIPVSVKEKAAIAYRKALACGLVRGRSIEEIVAASLYATCRATETPRTLKEMVYVSGIQRKDLARVYRLLLKKLEIKMPVEDPLKSISKIATKVRIPIKTQRKAIKILNEAKKRGAISGKDPTGMVAAALYLACVLDDVKITQREIAEAANVTEVTVRNRYKGLKEDLELNI